MPVGYNDATYVIQTKVGDGDWTDAGATAVNDSEGNAIPGRFRITSASDGEFMVQVVATATNDTNTDPQHAANLVLTSGSVSVDEIDPSASGVKAVRGVRDPSGTPVDTLGVSWLAKTDAESQHRVVIHVDHSTVGTQVWLVAPTSGAGTAIAADGTTRAWVLTLPATGSVAGWSYLDGTGAPDIPRADLLKALTVRVDARQEGVDEDPDDAAANPWPEERQGTSVSVAAKPDDS